MALPYSQWFRRIKREQKDRTVENKKTVAKEESSESLANPSSKTPQSIPMDQMKRNGRDHEMQSSFPIPIKRSLRRTVSRTFTSELHDLPTNAYALDLRRGLYMGASSRKENHGLLARKLLYGIKNPVIDNKKVMMDLFDGRWGTDGASNWWGRDEDVPWGSDTEMEGIRVEHKEKTWSEDLLYHDNKYGWFVARRPSHLRRSWTIDSEQQELRESRLDLRGKNSVDYPPDTEEEGPEENFGEPGYSSRSACNSP
jgi:hypothetical protein